MHTSLPLPVDRGDRRRGLQLLAGIVLFILAQAVMMLVARLVPTGWGLLNAQTHGPAWLTGGEMGIEGSLVSVLLGLAAGVVMLVLAGRRGRLLPPVRGERARRTLEARVARSR